MLLHCTCKCSSTKDKGELFLCLKVFLLAADMMSVQPFLHFKITCIVFVNVYTFLFKWHNFVPEVASLDNALHFFILSPVYLVLSNLYIFLILKILQSSYNFLGLRKSKYLMINAHLSLFQRWMLYLIDLVWITRGR